MNKIFPPIRTTTPVEVTPGSIIRISRSSETLLALVTSQKPNEASVSIVLLNLRRPNFPSVIFADNWRLTEPCLCYSSGVEFEINTELIDPRGNEWWETPGVIVSIADQLYIRAGRFDRSFGWPPLINIQTGELYSDQNQGNLWTFGGWTLWVKDEDCKRTIKLCDFNVAIKQL